MTAREVVEMIEHAGWRKDRQRGSHAVFKHAERSGRIVVPMHNGDLPKGTVRDILKKAGIQR
jgi:predicted RNA binding protein YcfA (HicA-like mRNA interferase family)